MFDRAECFSREDMTEDLFEPTDGQRVHKRGEVLSWGHGGLRGRHSGWILRLRACKIGWLKLRYPDINGELYDMNSTERSVQYIVKECPVWRSWTPFSRISNSSKILPSLPWDFPKQWTDQTIPGIEQIMHETLFAVELNECLRRKCKRL